MQSRLEEAKISAETYLPKPIQTLFVNKMANLDQKLKSTHILILNGENDELVKAKFNEPLVQSLRKIHVGKEGIDWKFYLVPGVGHEWSSQMVEASVDWAYQWMVKNTGESKL
jgi:predicted esterase